MPVTHHPRYLPPCIGLLPHVQQLKRTAVVLAVLHVTEAMLRDGSALSPLPHDEPLQAGDTMLVVGAHEDLTRAVARLDHAPE